MKDVFVFNITALLGGVVPAFMLRFTETRNFRWIAGIALFILFAVGLQYMILAGPRPAAQSETAIASDVSKSTDDFEPAVNETAKASDVVESEPDVVESESDVAALTDDFGRMVDEIEYKLGLAPLPDDAEFHYPTWHYHYNDGYNYVEGYSEVRLHRNMPMYQYRARIQCSEPNTLYLSLLEGYFDYGFYIENSPQGHVTRVSIDIDNQTRVIAEKVRVADGSAVVSIPDLVKQLSEGVLLRVELAAQVERFGWEDITNRVIFDLNLFDWHWRECSIT